MPTTFANTIDGNDIYAKRAECDAAGNNLSVTYATKSELPDGVPAVTSSDDGKVLKAAYSQGQGSFSWETESGGTQVQSDWTETDTTDPSFIQNKPTSIDIVAGSNVTITEGVSSITIAATDTTYSAGTGLSLSGTTFSNSDPLPSHTSTESGKVLGVDSNGDLGWVAQSGGGSDNVFVAEYGVTSWSDINTAFLANKALFAYYNGHTYVMSDMVYSGSLQSVTFTNVRSTHNSADNDLVDVWFVMAQSTGTTWSSPGHSTGYLVDMPDSGDEGKVLKAKDQLSGSGFEWATLSLGSVQSIQQVNSLPAQPDANTLYLIPET